MCGNRLFAPHLFTYVLVTLIRLRPTTDAKGRPDTVARSVGRGAHLAHSPAATGGAGAAGSSLVVADIVVLDIAGDGGSSGAGSGSSPVCLTNRPLAYARSTEPAPVRAAIAARPPGGRFILSQRRRAFQQRSHAPHALPDGFLVQAALEILPQHASRSGELINTTVPGLSGRITHHLEELAACVAGPALGKGNGPGQVVCGSPSALCPV